MTLFKITPKHVSSYVNFHFSKKTWKYDQNGDNDMAKLQAEGAAKVYNILLDKKIALLADEVGMGKTIEGLAILVTLWRQKPDAKVLLYAPNELVAKKWITEYNNFIDRNYKGTDDLVKSTINNKPLRKAVYCHNQEDLMEKVNLKWPSFFVCKTSSLSGFLPSKRSFDLLKKYGIRYGVTNEGKLKDDKLGGYIRDIAIEYNENIYKAFSNKKTEPPFDLIIFDEAHYLRRTEPNSDSNRSIAAHAFFSHRDIKADNPFIKTGFKPLADKILLLTATPNHSANTDIKNMVNMFSLDFIKHTPEDILKEICVRRFRRLAGKTKYQYRKEIPGAVELSSLSEKLFFASYQKALVKAQSEKLKNGEKVRTNPYRVLFGYLEGFEFLPNKKSVRVSADSGSKDDKGNSGDFKLGEDASVIEKLSEIYHKAYKDVPAHPKYEEIIKTLSPHKKGEQSKKLVFVRRIPSVYEIARRVINEYDKVFLSKYFTGVISDERIKNYSKTENFLRAAFVSEKDDEEIESDSDSNNTEDNDRIQSSRVFDLFTKKKSGRYKSTDCSNFRLRFTVPYQIFSVFFQPAKDYKSEKYNVNSYFRNNDRHDYLKTIKKLRFDSILNKEQKVRLEGNEDSANEQRKSTANESFDTLLGIWYRKKVGGDIKLAETFEEAKKKYDAFSEIEREAFSGYLEAGVLFSSEYIFEFYSVYKAILKSGDFRGGKLYRKFCSEINKKIIASGLLKLISEAIISFKTLYRKEFSLDENTLLNEKWNFLKYTHPVYPYSAESKRHSIVKAFNTPFYPDVLVATSVLQEGVDLHYHCSEVIHYGIAWTQGDNEQRVGRVDRLFGKLNIELEGNKEAVLPIHYPYLKNTIDEEQVKRFVKRKSESEKLIDQFISVENRNELSAPDMNTDDWHSYFNSPEKEVQIEEPLGVKAEDFKGVNIQEPQVVKNRLSRKVIDNILNSLENKFGNQLVYAKSEDNQKPTILLAAIKYVDSNTNRHQPVIIELEYFEQGVSIIGKPTYVLRIKTPVLFKDKVIHDSKHLLRLKGEYLENPLIKINYKEQDKGNFRLYVSTELPLFMVDNKDSNISSPELIMAIEKLIPFADNLERELNGEAEIKNDIIMQEDSSIREIEDCLIDNRGAIAEFKSWRKSQTVGFMSKSSELELMNNTTQKQTSIDTFIFNSNNPLVRKTFGEGKLKKEVGIYRDDALVDELALLENVLKNVKNN
ncbi:DEAD/DEAH box helicase [Plebeiibacterium sediminum]|uniref:DEAD/DEAH box helicase n=1 Tax=Plebeiibacterium sediminum TaxID=2992112 RepID=A0AAE3M8N6_9BACT|nr:DEAD/DEAH box helicase [Plebeiobacterium sediminum]MCW3789281.1 DEAD/DEAH box helicase [Plebeiobacterium sediminum]